MVHMHYTQPLKIKFGTNHFFGSETLVPIQYRERVNQEWRCICTDTVMYIDILYYLWSDMKKMTLPITAGRKLKYGKCPF